MLFSSIDYTYIEEFIKKVEGQKLFTIFFVKLLFQDICRTLIFVIEILNKVVICPGLKLFMTTECGYVTKS